MTGVELPGLGKAVDDSGRVMAHQCVAIGCGKTSIPGHGWHCRHCGSVMLYGFKRAPCPKCGTDRMWTRQRNQWDCHCHCDETPEQRADRLKHEANRARREAKERAEEDRKTELKRARVIQAEGLEKAANCWNYEKKRRCSVSKSDLPNAPRPFCRFCPKFAKE